MAVAPGPTLRAQNPLFTGYFRVTYLANFNLRLRRVRVIGASSRESTRPF